MRRKQRNQNTRAVQCPGCNTSFQVMDRTAPAYAPAVKAPQDPYLVRAVIAPMRQSFISAGYAALASGAVVGLTEYARLWPQVALLSGALCGGGVWLLAAWDDNRLRWKVEAALGLDLDRDAFIGEPPPVKAPDPLGGPAPPVLVPDKKPGHKYPSWNSYNVPWGSYREARNVARAVIKWDRPFTRRELQDRGIMPKDDAYYTPIYQAMLDNGFLKKGKTKPTKKGRLYLEGLLSPTPLDDVQK